MRLGVARTGVPHEDACSLMSYLIAAMIAPLLGPALYTALRRQHGAFRLLDGFVYLAVPGLVFLHVFPFAAEQRTPAPVIAVVLGLLLPTIAEKTARAVAQRADTFALIFAFSGLALHALLDGAALAPASQAGDLPFGLAVTLHRIPVGLAIWWLVRPKYGLAAALLAIGSLVVATVVGYSTSTGLLASSGGNTVALYQAFVGGSLIHVVFHQGHPDRAVPETPALRRFEGVGGLLAFTLLIVLARANAGDVPADAVRAFGGRFMALALLSAPALVLAYLAAGALNAFLPGASIRWLGKGGSLSSAIRGTVVGLPFPICSCGVVPIYRTLVARGAPAAAAMAFLVATPELGIDAVLLSVPLLGMKMTWIRVIAAAFAALLVGWLVGRMIPSSPPSGEGEETAVGTDHQATFGERARAGLKTGLGDVVDHTAPWILLGLAIAAAIEPFLAGGWLASIPGGLDVLLFALLGVPTYVCASSATPLVAALMIGGLSPGAALAFLITGPATNATTFGLLSSLHGWKAALAFSLTLITFSVAFGFAINGIFGTISTPPLDGLIAEDASLLKVVSLWALLVLFLASLLRRGVRRFLGELRHGLSSDAQRHVTVRA